MQVLVDFPPIVVLKVFRVLVVLAVVVFGLVVGITSRQLRQREKGCVRGAHGFTGFAVL